MVDRSGMTIRVTMRGMLVGPVISTFAAPVWAGPEGQQVVAGSASFARNGAVTTITAANKTIINYTGFNIAGHETVRFIQPDSSSRVLNRIGGSSPTHIDGSLIANGIVYIVNPAGVVFGKSAMIDVGGLHAAAASMANSDFIRGIDRFTDAQGSVANHGTIMSPEVTLFGRAVENTGSVISTNGVVAFVAGEDLFLGERGGNLYLKVEGVGTAVEAGGVQNLGTISAPGGKVMVGSGDMFGVMLASTSRIAAKEISIQGGKGAITSVSGTLDASSTAPNTFGGSVDVRGDRVGLFDATIDASGPSGGGDVRIGGDFHGGDGPRAARTYISDGSTVRADATESGDGGSVVVWSDEVTRFNGNISARGAGDGDGGSAEVSGKQTLLYNGFTDLRSPHGAKGTLLLDPKNIRIEGTGVDPIPGDTAFGDASSSDRTFSPSTVVTALNGADLVLQANNDITVVDPIDASVNPGNGNLQLQAGRSILIEADITLRGSFSATANDIDGSLVSAERDPGAATITMSPGTTIDTSTLNRNISLEVLAGGAADTSASTMTVGSLDAGTGHVFVRYLGPTANQGIQRADGASLINAASAAFVSGGAGDGGFLGTSAEPLQLSVVNLEASSQRNGAYFTNDQNLVVGGANLGGLSGITVTSASAPGDLDIDVTGRLNTTEAITVARNATLSATDGVTLGANVTTNATIAGTSSINTDSDGNNNTSGNADPLVVGAGATLNSSGSDLSLTVGDLSINAAGAITTGSGNLSLTGSAAANLIGIGSGVVGSNLTISKAELARITSDNLSIGDSGTTSLTVGGLVATDFVNVTGSLELAADNITFQSFAEFKNVAARATDSVIVQNHLSTTAGDLLLLGDSDAIAGGADNVQISANRSLFATGDLDVSATNGITVAGAAGSEVTFTGSTVTLGDIAATASGVRVQAGGNIQTGAISIGAAPLLIELDAGDIGTFGAQLGQINAGSTTVSAGNNDSVTFTGTITTSLAAGVDVDGGTVTFQDDLTANGAGIVRITNVGVLSITEGAPIVAGGGFVQDGPGSVTLGADISTTGDAISFLRPVTLADTASDLVTIDSTAGGSPAGSGILFTRTINGTVAGGQSLALNAGTAGDITFTNGVGSVTRLGTISVTNARNVTATLAVQANAFQQVAGTGLTNFIGTLTTIGGGIDLNGAAFTFASPVNSASGGPISITNSGLLTVGSGATISATGGFFQDASGAVSLGSNITTTGDAVSFAGPVTLADTASDLVTIDTTSGPSPLGGTVTFGSTLNPAAAGAQSLTINAGTAGDALFVGAVGTIRLGTLTITNARDFIASSSVLANTIRQVAGQRVTRFDGTVATTSASGIDLDGTAFTFNDDVTANVAGVVRVTNSGTLTIADGAHIIANGGFAQDGTGSVSLGADITTSGDAVSFSGPVTLADTASDLVTIDTTSGGNAAGADIAFGSALAASSAGAQSITLNAGTGGDANFTGAIGTTQLGTLTVTNARDFVASSTLSAGAVRQLAGQRLTRFDGVVSTSTAAGVDLDGAAVTFNDDVNATGSGIVRVTNSGLLTIADGAPILAQGGFVQDGAGLVSLGANITTNGSVASFLRAVTLADTASDLVTINTTNGGAAAGANVTFSSTLNAAAAEAQSLTINAGTGGDILFTSAVGASVRPGTLTITNASDVTAASTVAAGAIRQIAGQQLTRFNAVIDTSTAAGIDLDGTSFTFNDDVSTGGDGIFRVTNSGTLTIATGAPIVASGAITQDGPGAVTIGSNLTAAGISFAGPSTLTAPATLTGSSGGVAFGSTLATGGNNLTIVSDGAVTFGAAVTGGGASLLLVPTLASTPIDLGTITGGSSGGTLTLSAASASRLDGFSLITIGRDPATSTHAIRTGTVTFNDPVLMRTGSAGSLLVRDGGITGTGDASISLTGPTTLNTSISNPGRNITVTGDLTVGQGLAGTLSTGAGAGNILITGAIDGTDGGGSESLTLTAGTGTIELQGDVTGVDGLANPNGLTSLTFGSAAGVTLEAIAITGALTTTSALTGPFIANGHVAVGSVDMEGTIFTFGGGLTAPGGVSINNSGLLTLLGGLTTNGPIEIGGPALLSGVFSSTNNPITLGGAVTLAGDSEFAAGTSTFTLGAAGSIDTNGNALTLTADDMVLASAPGAITSGGDGGNLLIQPGSAARGISLSSPTVNPSGGFLGLATAEVATLAEGFDSVTFGRSNGTHEIRVGTLAISDPLLIQTPLGGSVFVGNGGITGSDNATIVINGSGATTTLAANLITSGTDITISDSLLIGANVLISTGVGTAGNISIVGTTNQVTSSPAGTFGLTTQSGLGDTDFGGAIGASRALAALDANGANINIASIGASGVGVTGSTSLSASNALTLLGTTYRSGSTDFQGASIQVESPATTVRATTGEAGFTGPVLLASDADLDINAATNARFSSTINGTSGGPTETLNVVAGSLADFDGAIGSLAPLHTVGISAGAVELGNVSSITSQSISGTSGVALSGALTSSVSGDIEIDGPIMLASPVTIQTAGAGGDDISLTGTINGASPLTLTAGSGNASLGGIVGASTALDSLTVTAANIALEAIGAAGQGVSGITSIVGTTSITFNGLIYRANQQTYAAPTKSFTAGSVSIFSSSDAIALSGGSTQIASGPAFAIQSLGANVSLDTLTGPMAGKTVDLNAGAGTLTLAGVTPTSGSNGALIFTGDEIDLTGAIRGSSLVLQPSTPSLGIQVGLGAGGVPLNLTAAEMNLLQDGFSSITIGRESNGSHAIVTGPFTFQDPLRLVAPSGGSVTVEGFLTGIDDGSLFINGTAPTTLKAGILTSGQPITIDDNVVLPGVGLTLNTQGGSSGAFPGGDVTITGALDGPGGMIIVAGQGVITLLGPVGAGSRLLQLDLTGSSISLPGAATTNLQRYAGPVTATGSAPTFSTLPGSGSNIFFVDTLDTAGALTLNAAGAITFGGDVGATTRPASLAATASFIRFANAQIRTVGSQTYTGPAMTHDLGSGFPSLLTLATDGGPSSAIDFSSTFAGPGAIRLDAGAGTINMGGIFGNGTRLSSIDATGSSIATVGMNTTGNQIFRGPVAVSGSTVQFATTGGGITFQETLNGPSSVTINAGTGSVVVQGLVGDATPLTSLTATATSITLPGATTVDRQAFNGSVVASGTNPTFVTGGSSGDHIDFNGSLDATGDLIANAGAGRLTFGGNVGATTRPASLIATGSLIRFAATQVRTVGSQEFTGPASTHDSGAGFPATLVFATGGAPSSVIEFSSAFSGPGAIRLNAGSGEVRMGGIFGSATPVTSIDVTASTIQTVGVNSTGGQIFRAPVQVSGANVQFASSGVGNIIFQQSLDGASRTAISAGSGAVTIDGLVGATTPLTSLTATGASITLPGATTTDAQIYNGSIIATGANPSFVTGAATGDDIEFNGTLNTAGDLTADAGAGRLTFGGDVGNTTRPASLTATGSLIRLGGSEVRTVGFQDFNGPAITFNPGSGLPDTLTLATSTSSSIDFSSTLNGSNNLVLNAGSGTVSLGGVVGNSAAFSSVDVSGSAISTVGVSTTGNQTFRGPVAVSGSSVRFASSGGSIVLQQTLNGPSNIDLLAPLGQISFGAPVGAASAPSSIDAEADSIALASTTTVGSQRFIGRNTLNSAVSLTTGGASGAHITLGSVDGSHNLTLNAGVLGDITINQPVGATTPISDLRVTNARNVTAGAIAARTITQLAGTGLTSVTGMLSTFGAGGIDLNGAAFDLLGGLTAGGAGPISITNAGQLRLPAGSAIAYGGSFTQDGAGPVVLGTSLTNASQPISISSPVSLTGDVLLEGSRVTLAQDVNSAGGPRSLEVRSSGQINLAGVGNTAALSSLVVRDLGGATATLDGDISSQGPISIEPNVLVARDLQVTGLGGVSFGSTIDAAPSATAGLTIQVETLSANLPSDPVAIPVIELGGDIGADRALSFLEFNPVARDSVPQIASIVAREGISISSGDRFEMARNEKFTAIGDLSITADQAFVGDLSAFGDIFVDAGSIVIRTRDGATVLGPATPGEDQGVDFVGTSQISFSTTPALDGDGLVFFATESGGGFSSTLGAFPLRAFGSISSDIYFRGTTVLDLRAQGPTNTNVSEAIAGASPRETQSGNVRRDTSIGAAQEDQLREIGVDPRGLDVQTLVEALIGRSVYDDLPTSPDYKFRDTRITESRLTSSVVESALRTVAEVLGENNSERRIQMKANLLSAADAYLEKLDDVRVTDGAAFRRFVETSPEHAAAELDLQGLGRLFAQLRLLALTDFELDKAWQQISSSVTDRRLPAARLREAVERDQDVVPPDDGITPTPLEAPPEAPPADPAPESPDTAGPTTDALDSAPPESSTMPPEARTPATNPQE